MRRAVLYLVAAWLVLPAAPVLGQTVRKDSKRLQGDWLSLAVIKNGQEETERPALKIHIEGNTLQMKYQGKATLLWDATFKLTISKDLKEPREIDVVLKNWALVGDTMKGIYAFDGKNLKLCLALPGSDERPHEFGSPPGSNFLFVTLGRIKTD